MKSIFDKYYKEYDLWYDRYKFVFLSEIEAIKKVLPRNGKGLEIGVGTGRFSSALGISIGIDPSNKMLKIAQKRGVNARIGFGEHLPFYKGAFDYVIIIISLCFMVNPKEVLEEAWRVLKKNGRIIIGIVDKESFLGKFYRTKKSVFYEKANFFSVKEVTDLLKEVGFVSFFYYQTLSVLPNRLKIVEKPKKGFGRGGFVVIAAEK
jgi:ubiquinone/menaquinone biosynthesis C-methylase UbiE